MPCYSSTLSLDEAEKYKYLCKLFTYHAYIVDKMGFSPINYKKMFYYPINYIDELYDRDKIRLELKIITCMLCSLLQMIGKEFFEKDESSTAIYIKAWYLQHQEEDELQDDEGWLERPRTRGI